MDIKTSYTMKNKEIYYMTARKPRKNRTDITHQDLKATNMDWNKVRETATNDDKWHQLKS